MRRDRALGVALLSLTLLAGTPARAQGVDYAAALKQGTELYEKGDKLGAIKIWEQLLASLGETQGWKVNYNLGLAYESIGDPTRAVLRLEAFVKHANDAGTGNPQIVQRKDDALERLKAIKATHGAVNVKPPPSGAAVLVRVGATEARPAGFVVYLAPGDHEIELYAGTANAKRTSVHAVAGQSTDLVVPDLPSAEKPLKKEDPEPRRPAESFPTGWLIGGASVTLVSGLLPLFLGLNASDKREAAEAIPVTSSRYPAALEDFEGARSTYRISWVVPAVLAAATAVIVVLKLPSNETRRAAWSGAITF